MSQNIQKTYVEMRNLSHRVKTGDFGDDFAHKADERRKNAGSKLALPDTSAAGNCVRNGPRLPFLFRISRRIHNRDSSPNTRKKSHREVGLSSDLDLYDLTAAVWKPLRTQI